MAIEGRFGFEVNFGEDGGLGSGCKFGTYGGGGIEGKLGIYLCSSLLSS